MNRVIPNNELFAFIELMINEGTSVKIRVQGNSMRPTLRDMEDIVVLEPVNLDRLKAGDIVLFKYDNGYLLHRVVCRLNNQLIMKGDGNSYGQENIDIDQVVACVSKIIRKDGKIIETKSLRWRIWSRLYLFVKYFRNS